MELRPIAITSHAAARRDLRARHMAQVKFVALAMPLPSDFQQALAQGTGAPAKPAATLLSLLSRVIGRLVAARP
jgi:hypothetical protein